MDKELSIKILNSVLNELGLNKSQLATIIGVNPQSIHHILNTGRDNVLTENIAKRINNAFSFINLEYLLTGNGPIISNNSFYDRTLRIMENTSEALRLGAENQRENLQCIKEMQEIYKINVESNNKMILLFEQMFNEYKMNKEK